MDDELEAWIEQVAGYLAAEGTPPVAGRALGWLMVCEPEEQTATQICAAIRASRASLSVSMKLLAGMGFVIIRTKPGSRTGYYRLAPDAWRTVVARQIEAMTAFRSVTADGLRMLGDSPRSARLREAHDTLGWIESVFAEADREKSGKER